MANLVTLEEMLDQLSFTDDIGDIDDALITSKAKAAEAFCQQWLGYDPATLTPEPLELAKEAIRQIAAHWYENRETVVVGATANEVPISAMDILCSLREWTF